MVRSEAAVNVALCVCERVYIHGDRVNAALPRRAVLFFSFLFFSVVSAGPGQVVGYPVLLLRQRQAQRQAEREQAQVRTPPTPQPRTAPTGCAERRRAYPYGGQRAGMRESAASGVGATPQPGFTNKKRSHDLGHAI